MVGGGTSADVVFTPQTFPNAARPNNVIAPFWTDLNPAATGAGAIRIGTLTDGAQHLDRRRLAARQELQQRDDAHVRDLDPDRQRRRRNRPVERGRVDLTYGTGADAGNAGSGDPDSGENWGAENRDGTSGENIATAPANGSEYQVHTTPPTAGGSVSIPYDITSKKPGTYHSVASMTSPWTPASVVKVDRDLVEAAQHGVQAAFMDLDRRARPAARPTTTGGPAAHSSDASERSPSVERGEHRMLRDVDRAEDALQDALVA